MTGAMAFGRRLGVPEPHVIDPFQHPASADILVVSNVRRDGRPIGLPDDPRTLWRITVKPPGGLPA